jgi:hypothetical protein
MASLLRILLFFAPLADAGEEKAVIGTVGPSSSRGPARILSSRTRTASVPAAPELSAEDDMMVAIMEDRAAKLPPPIPVTSVSRCLLKHVASFCCGCELRFCLVGCCGLRQGFVFAVVILPAFLCDMFCIWYMLCFVWL